MRVLIVLTLLSVSLLPARAQILTIRAIGAVTSESGYDSSVVVGSPVTSTFTIDLNTPVNYSGAGFASYTGAGVNSTIVGDYSLLGKSTTLGIQDGVNGIYGFNFSEFGMTGGGFGSTNVELEFTSSDPSTVKSTLLTSVQQLPLTDFNLGTAIGTFSFPTSGYNGHNGSTLTASITGYTIKISDAPEPSSILLLVCGLVITPFIKRLIRI